MEKGRGRRGITVLYPEQRGEASVPYPYLLQGRGADIYVGNLNGVNVYKLVDCMTYRCDRQTLDRVFAGAFKVGIAIGGDALGGAVRNVNPNYGNWTFSRYPDCPGSPPPGTLPRGARHPVGVCVEDNLDASLYGAFLQPWIDGKLASEAMRLGPLPVGPAAPILLGQGFKGLLDEVRLHDRPLAEAEIKADAAGKP
jgi:hypothetical protein